MSKVTNIVIITYRTYILDLIVKSMSGGVKTVTTTQIDCFANVFKAGVYNPK
jgi:hypothetical protein